MESAGTHFQELDQVASANWSRRCKYLDTRASAVLAAETWVHVSLVLLLLLS
jgi:hypothetical protein